MPQKRRIKLSVLFISGLSVLLIALTIALSCVSLNSVSRLGEYAISVDKKNIKDTATLLFLEITNRTAEGYSLYFNNVSKLVSLLAHEARIESTRDYHDVDLQDRCNLGKFEDRNFYIDRSFEDRKAVLYWGRQNKLVQVEKKIDAVSAWFFPYVNALMELNSTYFYSIWIIYPDDNLYIADTYPFLNKKVELSFYEKIPTRKFLKTYFNEHISDYMHTSLPVWWKPYKGVNGEMFFSISCPIFDKNKKPSNAVVGIDLRMDKILGLMDTASMISEKKTEVSGEWKSFYKSMDGFTFILDKNADIILFPKDQLKDFQQVLGKMDISSLANSKNPNVRRLAKTMIASDNGVETVNLGGKNHIIAYSTIDSTGWILGFVTHENALMSSVYQTSRKMKKTEKDMSIRFVIIAFLFLVATILIIVIFFRHFLFQPMKKISREIRKMGEGNFDINLKEEGAVEIAELSTTFNYLGKELREYMENLKQEVAARQAVETEIEIAGKMQNTILPKPEIFADNKEFELYSKLVAAKDVSGDFFDFFSLDEDRIAFVIADVSGKGLQAAFFMAMSKILIKNLAIKYVSDPAKVLGFVNSSLCMDNNAQMFVTVFLVFYNTKTGEVLSANGGHHSAILLKADGTYSEFGMCENTALGIYPDSTYTLTKRVMAPKDTIVLYTDGIIEAISPDNIEFGERRLLDVLQKNRKSSLTNICEEITQNVIAFEKGSRFDDITIITLRRL